MMTSSTTVLKMPARAATTPQAAPDQNTDPVRAAFYRRSMEAVNRIAREAPTKTLTEALAATTDVGALARVLGDPAALGPAIAELEPLAPAIARNAEHQRELLEAAGGTLSADEVGSLLTISRQAVDKRRRAHGLLAVRLGGDWRYPRRQFDEDNRTVVAGLAKVLKVLLDSGPWVTLDFLVSPDGALGDLAPIDALRKGDKSADIDRLLRQTAGDGFA